MAVKGQGSTLTLPNKGFGPEHTTPLTCSYLHREDWITGSSLFPSTLPCSFGYRENCAWDLQSTAEYFLVSSLAFFFFLTQWYTCPLKLDYRSGVVGESEKCCGLSFSRGKDTLTMSLDKLCLWRQEQSSFEETEVKTDFHLMVGTLRFF